MRHVRWPIAIGLALLCGCVHRLAAEPPTDAKERRRAEIAACQSGTFPPWLDDQALAARSRRDRWDALQFDPKDSYLAGTNGRYQSQPPSSPPAEGGAASRYAAIMNERRDFQARCQVIRSTRPGPALPSVR